MSQKLATDTLPSWNLSDFYNSVHDNKINQDLEKVRLLIGDFVKTYKEMFAKKQWQGKDLYQAIIDFEEIEELSGKLMSYAYLCYATNLNTPEIVQFFQHIQEQITQRSSDLIFFTLALNSFSDEELQQAYTTHKELKAYRPWLEGVRLFKNHQLSPELERFIHEKSITGRSAWVRLYDETLASIRFSFEGKSLTLTEIINYFSDKDAHTRAAAAKAMSQGLTQHLSILSLVTNTLAKDKEIEDTWRHYPEPAASRHLANQVEAHVVNALSDTVKANYAKLTHRYYALKAKWLGQKQIEYWDRNAPLPDADDHRIEWAAAQETVLTAYHEFSPALAEIGQRFFKHGWIDVSPKPGKQSGAFAHPTVPSVHPYLLLNYQGKLRDVMTLAHELGHGVHQILAAEQGLLLSQTPLTIAETASVFGEMLTFKALLQQVKNPQQRRSLIAAKVEDMLNTVVRQIAFYEFEQQVHQKRRQGELSAEQLGNIWLQTQNEALGSAVNLDESIKPYWSYISHFIHAPFYVYAYAFGDCLVNSLYAVYQQGHPGFAEKYLNLLRAGGSKRYPELLAPFGLDAGDPKFWQQGINVILAMIDELETL